MATFLRTADLRTLITEAQQIDNDVQRIFETLTPEQLNWQPHAKEWSVGQCFEHLTIATSSYFPMLRQILGGTRRHSPWERLPILPDLWSKLLFTLLEPDGSGRAVAPPSWQPSRSTIDEEIIATFLRCHAQCTDLLRQSDSLDLSMVVTSPAAGFVTYRLLDAYRIIIIHDRLHMGQAQRVMQQPGFPALVRN